MIRNSLNIYSYNSTWFWFMLAYFLFQLIIHWKICFYSIERNKNLFFKHHYYICLEPTNIRPKNKLYTIHLSVLSIILWFRFSWGLLLEWLIMTTQAVGRHAFSWEGRLWGWKYSKPALYHCEQGT